LRRWIDSQKPKGFQKTPETDVAIADTILLDSISSDPDLQYLIRVWSQMPASVRSAITSILKEIGQGK